MKTAGTDFDQALMRVFLVGVLVAFSFSPLLPSVDLSESSVRGLQIEAGLYIAYAVLWLAWVVVAPAPSYLKWRRYAGAFLDNIGIAGLLFFAGQLAFPAPAAFLWVHLGYALRMGPSYLAASALFAIVAFSAVIIWSPHAHFTREFIFTTWAILIVPPVYLGKLAGDLQSAKRKAEDSARAKTSFLAQISHDFRTPLFTITGLTEELTVRPAIKTDPGAGARLDTIRASSALILDLVDAALDAARSPDESRLLVAGRVDLYAVIAGAVAIARQRSHERGLAFGFFVSPDLPRFVATDDRRLRRALLNLLDNAVKFTAQGSVALTVTLQGHPARHKAALTFCVVDTGPGIALEEMPVIFDAFTRGAAAEGTPGVGLGTTIAREFIEQLGGTLLLDSRPGKGSTFSFSLVLQTFAEEASRFLGPATPPSIVYVSEGASAALGATFPAGRVHRSVDSARRHIDTVVANGNRAVLIVAAGAGVTRTGTLPGPEDGVLSVLVTPNPDPVSLAVQGYQSAVNPAEALVPPNTLLRMAAAFAYLPEETPVTGNTSGRALRILVAEDHDLNLGIIMRMLREGGHHPVGFEDGAGALRALTASPDAFDFLILDQRMPGASGTECAQHYLSMGLPHPAPVIFLSADSAPAYVPELSGLRTQWLTKPVERERLLSAIADLSRQGFPADVAPQRDDDARRALFRDRLDGEVVKILDLLTSGNAECAGEAIHRLKGASAYLGGEEMVGQLDAAMRAVGKGEMDVARKLIGAVRAPA